MTNEETTRAATASEEQALIATLLTAFSSDPAARWAYPSADLYLASFPAFARAFGGNAFWHGTAHVIGEFSGAALWLPPNVGPDEETMMALLQSTLPAEIQQDAFAVFEQMGRCHPAEAHWYLPLIGVDPPYQGRGYGAALLKYALAMCDSAGTCAYLESSNERNIPLYERHGFEVMTTIQVGSSPKIYPMLRPPQSR